MILQIVVVVDDEDRENEGDLIMAASLATPEAMAFIVKHGTGIVCVSMKGEDLERLEIPLMVTQKDNDEKLSTAFTVSVVCVLFFPLFFWSFMKSMFFFLFQFYFWRNSSLLESWFLLTLLEINYILRNKTFDLKMPI